MYRLGHWRASQVSRLLPYHCSLLLLNPAASYFLCEHALYSVHILLPSYNLNSRYSHSWWRDKSRTPSEITHTKQSTKYPNSMALNLFWRSCSSKKGQVSVFSIPFPRAFSIKILQMVKVKLCKKEQALQIAEEEYCDLKVSGLKCYYSAHLPHLSAAGCLP